jgi:hypothetical protein
VFLIPLYVWRCETGHEEEVFRVMADATKPLLCGVCFTAMKRVFTPPALISGQETAANKKFDDGMHKKFAGGTAPRLPDYKEHTPDMPKRSGLGDMREYLEDKYPQKR